MAKKTRTPGFNRGFCLQTSRGNTFDPKVAKISKIEIEDIAHSLSNICRYSGHCRKFYSVAEHSVLVSRIIAKLWPDDKNAIWAGLLHDTTEAYVGDVTTPLKVLIPKLIEIEDKIAQDLAKKFKIKWDRRTVERVKIADLTALSTEARELFSDVSRWDIIKLYEPQTELLEKKFPVSPEVAKRNFLKEFKRLQKERIK